MKHYLEYKNNRSSKFYDLELGYMEVLTHWGRIGRPGNHKTYTFIDHESAALLFEKFLKAKCKKGYKEVIQMQLCIEFEILNTNTDNLINIDSFDW